ncbi:hypothetical protein [Cysteiniphilum sp. 6C5]|uniref:hypothetical protein n=1 Tax=unclassified Cysteiniphilum TaxID=2610889 RepID=UPI003F87B721
MRNQCDFNKQWQTISIDLDNLDNSTTKEFRIVETGANDSLGGLLDIESVKISPVTY